MPQRRSGSGIPREIVRALGLSPALVDDEFENALLERLHGIGEEVVDEDIRKRPHRYFGENHETLRRDRAFEIWVREGRPEGRALDNWIDAERELRTEQKERLIARQTPHGPAAPPTPERLQWLAWIVKRPQLKKDRAAPRVSECPVSVVAGRVLP